MEKVFTELTSVYGFIGICLYDAETGMTDKVMPEAYTENELAEIADMLIALYQSGADLGPLHDVTVYEGTKLFLLRKITNHAFVCVLAEADTNLFLLRIALNLLSDDLMHRSGALLQS
ncbi:MAG: hypothetical protein ACOCS6_01785 [Desulfosalsimonas sp.]